MISRRSLIGQVGWLAAAGAGAWLARDYILWRTPEPSFAGVDRSSGWLPFAAEGRRAAAIEVEANGTPVRALIDSGAQYSVIDRALADQLGLDRTFAPPLVAYGVGGNPQLGRGASLDVRMGALALPALRAAVLELGPITGPAGLEAPLILGQDLLQAVVADIDFPGRRVRLLGAGHSLPEGAIQVPARKKGRALMAQVTVESAPLEVVLDTGASSALVLAADVAEAAGLLADRPVYPSSSIVLGGVIMGRRVVAERLQLGGQVLHQIDVHIFEPRRIPGFPRGLLGVEALADFRVLLDAGAGRLHLVRSAPPARPRRRRRLR